MAKVPSSRGTIPHWPQKTPRRDPYSIPFPLLREIRAYHLFYYVYIKCKYVHSVSFIPYMHVKFPPTILPLDIEMLPQAKTQTQELEKQNRPLNELLT